MLSLIGIGLRDQKDISLKGLEAVKNSDVVYLENYTSKLSCSVTDLERLYGKKIILADRELVEHKAEDTILKEAQTKNVAFLVIGDVFGATTHVDILIRAKKAGINIDIIHINDANGSTSLKHAQECFDENVACIVIQSPNYFGLLLLQAEKLRVREIILCLLCLP